MFQLMKADIKLNKRKSKQIQRVPADSEVIEDTMESNLLEVKQTDENDGLDLLQPISVKTQQGQNTNKEELSGNNLMCELCMCRLPSQDHILPHIKGKQHVNLLMKSIDIDTDSVGEEYISQTTDNQPNLNKKSGSIEKECIFQMDTVSKQSETKNNQSNLKFNTDCKICMSSCRNNCLKTCEILTSNKITVEESKFLCTLCKRKIYTLNDTLQHIKGKSHVNKLQTFGIKYFLCTKSNNGGCANQIPTVNLSDSELNVSGNKKGSQNSNIGSTIYNIHLVSNNAPKEKHLTNNDETNKTKKIENRSNGNTASNNYLYYCELCNMHVDIMNLHEHVNTINHKFSVLGPSKEDKFLFKCFCCKSIIQGFSSLNNHLNFTKHSNNLIHTLKHIKTNNIETSTKDTLEDKSPLCSVLFPEIENVSEKSFLFFGTSNIVICGNMKNKIIYYCSICRTTLNTHHNLMCHSHAQTHVKKIQQLSPENKHSNIEMGKKQIITITDNSFDITNDISTEIKEVLHVSPLKLSKKPKHKEQKVVKRLNKIYCERYLEIEEKMFTVDKNKLHDIELNFKPFMPRGKKDFYCLACGVNVSKELDVLYEHACLKPHKNNVDTIKKDKDCEKLLKQYMQKMSKDSITCYICNSSIENDTKSIDAHINNDAHKKKHINLCTVIDNTFNSVITQYHNNLWYSIQKFSCVPCGTNFKYKMEFIQHIITKHNQSLEKKIFDFCIPCATLWLDRTDCYTEHCTDIVHKYLVKSKDFMVENLPECIKKLLKDVDKTSDILLQETQILMNDNIHKEVAQSLEDILGSFYPSIRAFLFGSRITGLGSANSDIDIYLDYGNTYYEGQEEGLRRKHLKCIEQILCNRKEEWEVKEVIEESRTPIIKLLYRQTGVQCDISIANGISVENSKLIRSFNDAYPPCRKLILFVKKWLSCFNLPARHGLTNYAIVWLVIFYLQLNSHLPSVAALIKEKNESRLICGWETGVAQPKNDNKSVQSISTLLLGFFKFYANFDYRHYIVCPLMGCTLAKKAFIMLHTLPNEMKPYINHVCRSNDPEYFRIDSPLCVQDPFDLSHNLTKAVSSITLKYFKQYCHDSASILEVKK